MKDPDFYLEFVFLSAEVESKKLLKKLNTYTKCRFDFFIMWQTRKIESIFKLKKKKKTHLSHVIYKGECICEQTHIGETARNLEVRAKEHSEVNKQSEPAKHIRKHPNHKFTWEVLTTVHSWLKRRIKEVFCIARFRPELNKQVSAITVPLTLFPMGTGIM